MLLLGWKHARQGVTFQPPCPAKLFLAAGPQLVVGMGLAGLSP